MVTINDVAKLAGVSAATVSRVANGNYRMETDKYRRVIEAMEQLNYFPRGRIKWQETETPSSGVREMKALVVAWVLRRTVHTSCPSLNVQLARSR